MVDKIPVQQVIFFLLIILSDAINLLDEINNDHFSENRNFEHVNMSAMIEGSATNRTKSDSNILIYNRVPKCASTTMEALLSGLRRRNNFEVETSKVYWK